MAASSVSSAVLLEALAAALTTTGTQLIQGPAFRQTAPASTMPPDKCPDQVTRTTTSATRATPISPDRSSDTSASESTKEMAVRVGGSSRLLSIHSSRQVAQSTLGIIHPAVSSC